MKLILLTLTHIQVVPNEPSGIKNAAIVMAITIINLMPQNPFWIGALKSRLDLTPIIITAINMKKQTRAKHIRYTAK